MSIVDQLHDEIDRIEDLRNRAHDLVRRVVNDELGAALEATAGMGEDRIAGALVLLAKRIEVELTPLTTEAFRTGLQFAKQRRVASGQG